MSASWLQLVLALAVMYLLVASAGYWCKQKRAQQEAHDVTDTTTDIVQD